MFFDRPMTQQINTIRNKPQNIEIRNPLKTPAKKREQSVNSPDRYPVVTGGFDLLLFRPHQKTAAATSVIRQPRQKSAKNQRNLRMS